MDTYNDLGGGEMAGSQIDIVFASLLIILHLLTLLWLSLPFQNLQFLAINIIRYNRLSFMIILIYVVNLKYKVMIVLNEYILLLIKPFTIKTRVLGNDIKQGWIILQSIQNGV